MSRRSMRVALALAASVAMGACAHGTGTVALVPDVGPSDPDAPASPELLARWEEAVALFARLDRGAWDGGACHQALGAFERANVASGGRSARAVYMAGLVSTRCGNAEGARALFVRALELEQNLCEARVSLALMSLEAGRAAEARRELEEAIARDNRCAPAYVNLAILESEVPAEREQALANLRRALAVRADYMPALDRMALVYLAQAEERPALLDLAEMVCRQAQLIDPGHAAIYNTWAMIDVARGELTRAVARLARAMELDPSFFEAHMNFGQITLGQRAYEDAARAFARAREIRPSSYDAALGLGVAMRGLRDPAGAEQMYRAALALDGDRAEAFFDLAVLYQEHRDGSVEQLGQALSYLEEFVRRARGEPRFAATLEEVVRWCEPPRAPARRRADTCRPGRAQNIITSLVYMEPGAAPTRPGWLRALR